MTNNNNATTRTYYLYTALRLLTGCAIALFLIMHFMVQDIMNDQFQSGGGSVVEHNIQQEDVTHDTIRKRKKFERKAHMKGHGDHRHKMQAPIISGEEQVYEKDNGQNTDASGNTPPDDNVHNVVGNANHFEIEQPSGEIMSTVQEYIDLRKKYDVILPDDAGAEARRLAYAQTVAVYGRIKLDDADSANAGGRMSYDPLNCPDEPPDGYPYTWNVLDVINHWPPDDPTPRNEIHQGLCVFQYATDIDKTLAYRKADLTVVRDDPQVLKTVERWGHPDYLKELLQNNEEMTEHSENNHFMYWKEPRNGKRKPQDWKPPTEITRMGYLDWLERADGPQSDLLSDKEHWYYRINAAPIHFPGHERGGKMGLKNKLRKPEKKGGKSNVFLFDELAFFQSDKNLYLVSPDEERGINCRFGMKGVIAENHYDASRNSIALMLGERRYILADPGQCSKLALYPLGHPSGRHSAVDWSEPDLEKYPQFRHAQVNEIVLQAGDVMYLPLNW
eukprot:CAMPEP_0116005442 /NCGR_PEP_ID=MMETSP0321-20121206/1167_1 /TAXON_ID=163516 /ORGANISM="Leptocylindrus danicus var. danicus, Strain B650" /LENGTH=502 /DNA_ID=CAMNT_0003473869 /DNA_START=34 /DNA_END=1539 /DNA_ORIENTATION=+